jgi:hypothetical protein
MRRSCKLVSSLSRSGGRRSSRSSRELSSPPTHLSRQRHENETPLSLLSHGVGLRSGLTLTFFQRYPTHGQLYTLCASFIMVVCLRCALSCSHSIIPSISRGLLHPPPSNVPIKWVCGLDRVAKQKHCVIYSFGLSLPSSPCPPEWLAASHAMHANPAPYII